MTMTKTNKLIFGLLLFPLSLLPSHQVLGATLTDARLDNPDGPLVLLRDTSADSGFGPGPTSLTVERGQGDAPDKAIKFYVPLESSFNGGNTAYFTGSVLPDIHSLNRGSGQLQFHLKVDLEGRSQYLHAALETSSGRYKILAPPRHLTENSEDLAQTLSFDELCSVPALNCAQFVDSTHPPAQTINKNLMFFLSESDQGTVEVAESDHEVKIFYEIFISNRIESTREIQHTDLDKGDGQLYSVYEGFSLNHMSSLYAYRIANCAVGASGTSTTFANRTPGGEFIDLKTTATSGEVKIKNLTNGQCYAIRLFYVDKFGFASQLSHRLTESPESISVLLKTQACFFLTAGFGREHFVVDFFRHFRDNILRKFFVGNLFIDFYETYAKAYAPLLLEYPWAAGVVRAGGYTLYALLKYWPLSFLLTILLSLYWIKRTFLSNNKGEVHGRP